MKRYLQKFDLWLGSIILILMVFVVVLQVVFRYFGHPLSWPEEVARWTMIWVTFAGASYSFRNGGLIRVEFFVTKFFPKKVQMVINAINMVLMMAFFGLLGYSSFCYMMLTVRKHQVYNVTRMPYAIVISALILGSILCIIFAAKQLIQLVLAYRQSDNLKQQGEGTE
ncbi:MAG: TRAP transporter small permease [Lawsonibacter sp.]